MFSLPFWMSFPAGLHRAGWLSCILFAMMHCCANPLLADDGAAMPVAGIWPVPLLVVYCIIVAFASLLGGWLPNLARLTHLQMQILISTIGGFMLGIGILHQLPHAIMVFEGQIGALDWCIGWMLTGIVVMFMMMRMFHFHHHEPMNEEAPGALMAKAEQSHSHDCSSDHDHDHSHDHDHDHNKLQMAAHQEHQHDHDCGHGHGHSHPIHSTSWVGIALGLAVHSLTDGLALGAHVQADLTHDPTMWLLGLGTFMGIAMHKPLDSLSITSLMMISGASRQKRAIVNLLYASLCPIGAMLFVVGVQSLASGQTLIVGTALAFSAGMFVCIALSDLLPEVEFHSHHRVQLSLAFLLGVGMAWAIGFLEPGHVHGGGHHHEIVHPHSR